MSVFERAFQVVVGEEGGYTTNPADPGNWTGGRCNVGQCSGTKFGISAASYPSLDIASLSLDGARAIYRRDYWDKLCADELPSSLALLVFDAAVNSGVLRAIKWLQAALRVTADGVIGPITLAAAQHSTGQGAAILTELQVQRLLFLTALPTWAHFKLGWSRRVIGLQYEALRIGGGV